ncbi:MAG: hypothetical protein HY054_03380 [Proteobacteria bacterium]|nr:hypothetical protein [Pseudomonadota bacterium]
MRVFAALIVSALALAACKPPGQNQPAPGAHIDPHALQIEIGRYGVMLHQTGVLTSTQLGAPDASAEDAKELARGLREAVWTYNIQRSQLCARNLFTETSCGPAFEPVWISEPPNARPTPEQLQSRSQEVSQTVQPFWNTICADARRRTQDHQQQRLICAIE